MNNPNPYHRFLIKHRRFCERPHPFDGLRLATTVEQINGRDTCLCSEHAGRLKAARKSEKHQESIAEIAKRKGWEKHPNSIGQRAVPNI